MNPLEMLRIGVYQGEFAPIKSAQIEAAKKFMEQMKLDYLFLMPTYISKENTRDALDSPALRLRLCELAFEGVDGVVISDAALYEEATIYSVLKELERKDARLFLLTETDTVLDFDALPCFEDILKLCYPSYVRWDDDPFITNRIVTKISDFYKKYGVMFRRIVVDLDQNANKNVRKLLQEGKDVRGIIPSSVEDYIRDLGLFI